MWQWFQWASGGREEEWRPFDAPCALQRFHCLGRMHPLVVTIPARWSEGRHPRDHAIAKKALLDRLPDETRVVFELETFRGLATMLYVLFQSIVPEHPGLEELAVVPKDGAYDGGARPKSLEWMETPPPAMFRFDFAPVSRATTALSRLQLAVPLPADALVELAVRLSAAAPALRVLELMEGAPISAPYVADAARTVRFAALERLRFTLLFDPASTGGRSAWSDLTADETTPRLRDADLRYATHAVPSDAYALVPRRGLRSLTLVFEPADKGGDGADPDARFYLLENILPSKSNAWIVDRIVIDGRALPYTLEQMTGASNKIEAAASVQDRMNRLAEEKTFRINAGLRWTLTFRTASASQLVRITEPNTIDIESPDNGGAW
jgi:hypothetical protein